MHKSGTAIVSPVIQSSIAGARLCIEPMHVGFFENCDKAGVPLVVKILYEHWMQRPSLLAGIVRGEAGFHPDKAVALVRDPRDGLISELMHGAYERIVEGAGRGQVDEWVGIVRAKEANPDSHSPIGLIGAFGRIFKVESNPDAFFEAFETYSAWIDENRDRFPASGA